MNIPGKSIFLERLLALKRGLGKAGNEFKGGYRGFSDLGGNSRMRQAGLGAARNMVQARFRAQMAMQGARRMAGRAGAPFAQAGRAVGGHVKNNPYAYGAIGGGSAIGGTKAALMLRRRRQDDQQRMMLRNPTR